MRKIKVFVDGHWFDDPFQSPCSYIIGLYSVLSSDPEFEIYIAARNMELLRDAFNNNSRINYLQYSSHSKYYRLAIDIPRLIKKYNIDIAHYQYVSPLIKNTKEIVTIHDVLFKDFPKQFPLLYKLSKDLLFFLSSYRADLIATVSTYSLNALIKHYKLNPIKTIITPNGISNDFLETHNEDIVDIKSKYNLDQYILCVSRIEPRKNHITLVKAYVQLQLWKSNIKLVLIGRKDIPVQTLETYIKGLPIEIQNSILHIDRISTPELISFYKKASIAIYPSIAEGFGIPPIEAACLKTKVLCSNATAMADFNFFGNDLFDPLNIEELKNKIQTKLSANDTVRLQNISSLVIENYNWKKIAGDFSTRIKKMFI
jgi:glycosyltransferase involved in cell wall biosynthesis